MTVNEPPREVVAPEAGNGDSSGETLEHYDSIRMPVYVKQISLTTNSFDRLWPWETDRLKNPRERAPASLQVFNRRPRALGRGQKEILLVGQSQTNLLARRSQHPQAGRRRFARPANLGAPTRNRCRLGGGSRERPAATRRCGGLAPPNCTVQCRRRLIHPLVCLLRQRVLSFEIAPKS